jgi:hypothetical protein
MTSLTDKPYSRQDLRFWAHGKTVCQQVAYLPEWISQEQSIP